MVLRPIGDLPPSVYWVRRLLVLGGALLLLWVAWLLFWPDGGGADESGTPAAATSPSVTSTPTPTPTDTETKSAGHKKPKPSETTKSPAALEPACDDNDIAVTVTTDADTYPPGRDPSFTLGVKNVSKKTCSRDVGQAALELQVTSGGDQVWSSDDCSPGGSNDRTNLAPGHQYVQSVAWSRQESSAGCPASPKAAPAGDYQVVARNLEKFSEPASFTLS